MVEGHEEVWDEYATGLSLSMVLECQAPATRGKEQQVCTDVVKIMVRGPQVEEGGVKGDCLRS